MTGLIYGTLVFAGTYAGGFTAAVLFIRIISGFWVWDKDLNLLCAQNEDVPF